VTKWGLELESTEALLQDLKPEHMDMVLRRFSFDPTRGTVSPDVVLAKYVESCVRKGFRERHSSDPMSRFASDWELPLREVGEILRTLSLEDQEFVMKGFWCTQSTPSAVLERLKQHVASFSEATTPAAWQEFAERWQLPLEEVVQILSRLQPQEAQLIVDRFYFDRNSTQATPSAQLRKYVQTCKAKGFWIPTGATW